MNNKDYLIHYGVLGMKWGVRRYQNPDGSLTEAGRKRTKRQLKKDKRIRGAGYYKGGVFTTARVINSAMQIKTADIIMRGIASQGSTAYKIAMSQGRSRVANGHRAVTTAAWLAVGAAAAYSVGQNIKAEVYSRNKEYKKKVDSRIKENTNLLNNKN